MEKNVIEQLVYSKELDQFFCFCSRLFSKGFGKGKLAIDGFNDWTHASTRLKRKHENIMQHFKNIVTWYDLHLRFQKNEIIDKVVLEQLEKEKDHGKNVLLELFLLRNTLQNIT